MSELPASVVDGAGPARVAVQRNAAVPWYELVYDGLEDASRRYFAEGSEAAMFDALERLHDLIESEPPTPRDAAFVRRFGDELRSARDLCARYRLHGAQDDLNQAWDIYYGTFQHIARRIRRVGRVDAQQLTEA